MASEYKYNCDHQFERYLEQIMRAFSGFKVIESINRADSYRRVPVVYGPMSRIVASILNKRDETPNVSVPMMALNLQSIEMSPENKISQFHLDAVEFTDRGGRHRSAERIVGPAFDINVELSIYADSSTQLFEIMEQILLIFNPRVTIQTGNDIMNSDYITQLELTGISNEVIYPIGTDSRTVMYSLNFTAPIRLRYPYNDNAPIIAEIRERVFEGKKGKVQEPIDEIVIRGDD